MAIAVFVVIGQFSWLVVKVLDRIVPVSQRFGEHPRRNPVSES
jgi:hypothetical protein